MTDNPFARLGLQKDLVESLHRQGRLDDFLRTYYRNIQVHVHPDRGGDGALAATINAAYNEIQRKPASVQSWIQNMSNGHGINPEYLELIEGLTAKVEELQGVEKDYRKLQEDYAILLASQNGDGTKADVRRASPKAKRKEDVFADDSDEDISVDDAPEVKRPRAKRVDADADAAARTRKARPEKAAHSTVEPIMLENIILYGRDGIPARVYKHLELDREAVRRGDGRYLTKSQEEWETYFAGSGKKLPTAAEWYAIMDQMHTTKHPALKGIILDLTENWLCTSTRINYAKNIIRHPDFGDITTGIPSGDHWLDEVVKKKVWKDGLEMMLLAKDAHEAVKTLHAISGKRPYIWTPDAAGRKSNPERAVWLNIGTDWFILNCYIDPIGNDGRARGVRVVGA